MHVVVPFAGETPKSRLASVLDPEERRQLACAMLADVCVTIRATGLEPTVVSTTALAPPPTASADVATALEAVRTRVDDRPLSEAVNAVLETHVDRQSAAVAIVMADLPLIRSATLEALVEQPGDVVIAPGRGGGTNALVVRHPAFRTDYHGASYLDHRRIADDIDADTTVVDSFRLATDVDEPDDLVEAWLHGGPHTRAALEALGFALERTAGRVELTR